VQASGGRRQVSACFFGDYLLTLMDLARASHLPSPISHLPAPMPKVILSSSVDGELIRYAARCLEQCHQVEIDYTVSEATYRKQLRGGRIERLALRLKMYLWHPLRLCFRILFSARSTSFVVTTNPFFAPGLAAVLGQLKRQQVVHLLYDLFPDALEEAGLIQRNGFTARMLGIFPKLALRYSSCSVFLGESLQLHAEQRWGKAKQSRVIPVVMSEPIGSLPVASKDSKVEIHYGGQLGWMHDAERLVRLVKHVVQSPEEVTSAGLKWSFLISGAKAAMLRKELDGLRVEIGATLSVAEWRARALQAEVGIVSLSAGGAKVCLPSKTYGMMACGMAILALCPKDSDLGRLIATTETGWVVDTSITDSEQLQAEFNRVLSSIIDEPDERLRRRRNAWLHIQAENQRDKESGRWVSILE
jgi:hypothetical protein